MKWHDPLFLLLFILCVPLLMVLMREKARAGIRYSSIMFLKGIHTNVKTRLSKKIGYLRLGALFFIILALARPQTPLEESKIQKEGVDIVLAVDCSTSMRAEDFVVGNKRYNRLDVVKRVVKQFIAHRVNDRIGIIAFAGRAYMISPLTLDHAWLLENFARVETGMIEDGTAIGSGLMMAIDRLKSKNSKGKIVILLTDGVNNAGTIAPLTAAEAAKALHIRVYTIGAGTKGLIPYPATDFFGNKVYQSVHIDLDEDLLKKIADLTGGVFFRATDTKSLEQTYEKIDRIEKSPQEETGYLEYNELFVVFLFIGLCFLLCEIILKETFLRQLP